MVGSVDVDSGSVRRARLGIRPCSTAWSPRGWPLIFVAHEFNTRHRGPRADLWRLDELDAKPYKILAQPGEEIRPQVSRDGSKVLYVRKHRGRRNVWIVNTDGSNLHPVTRGFWLAVAAWAPDGKRIAIAGLPADRSGYRLYIASASGGGLRSIPGTAGATNGLAWTPDGRWITYANSEGRIWRVRPDGSNRKEIGYLPNRGIRRLLWSPDGRHLAYTAPEWETEYD